LGKTHYLVKSLIEVGWVKLENFRRSDNKIGYMYLLTPAGMSEKAKITQKFLTRKENEYQQLKREIEQLKTEIEQF
jgi:EPS-associated MarR family transcriptional regulator